MWKEIIITIVVIGVLIGGGAIARAINEKKYNDKIEKIASEIYAEGKGTESNPYIVDNAYRLSSMSKLDKFKRYFKLTVDIDLADWEGEDSDGNPTTIWKPIVPFEGYFDGDNHTIKNLNNNLFGSCSGEIKNLNLDVNIDCNNNFWYLGTIANSSDNLIENCHVTGTFKANTDYGAIGGLVGESTGTIRNCTSSVKITTNIYSGNGEGRQRVGGIAGYGTNIENCVFNGTLDVTAYVRKGRSELNRTGKVLNSEEFVSTTCVGGIVGMLNGTVEKCVSDVGKVRLNAVLKSKLSLTDYKSNMPYVVGGIAGINKKDGSIKNCAAVFSVSEEYQPPVTLFEQEEYYIQFMVAGVAGISDGKINNVISHLSVTNTTGYGVIFGGDDHFVSNCYYYNQSFAGIYHPIKPNHFIEEEGIYMKATVGQMVEFPDGQGIWTQEEGDLLPKLIYNDIPYEYKNLTIKSEE